MAAADVGSGWHRDLMNDGKWMIIDVNNLADQTLDGEHVKSEGSLQAV
jgi:hypothetical protein